MTCKVTLGDWQQQGAGARAVRQQVFILEQKIPLDLEWDQMDALSLHALASDWGGQIVGTGRLLPDGHIGRMAVCKDCRGRGVGAALLRTLMAEARRRGDRSVLLHAQTSAVGFYQHFGFIGSGDEFFEAGISHLLMRHDFA